MLIVPAPLPDEIDCGYLGRIMRINGVAKEAEILIRMAEQVGMGNLSKREAPPVVLLSRFAHMEVMPFVKQHTTLPLRRGITSFHPEVKHGCKSRPGLLWNSAMRPARPAAYFCPNCVEEDEDYHGLSYWRREHQIPGLFWCPKHGAPLHYKNEADAFLAPPSQFMGDCHTVLDGWVEKAFDTPVVQRFLAISSELMGRDQAFSVQHVSAVLRKRAAAYGFQTYGGTVKNPLLSDAVVHQFGREWLATVLPTLADKQEGVLLPQMDGVLFMAKSASSTAAYILALSLLFETPESALNAIIQSDEMALNRRRRRAGRTISAEDYRLAYIKSRGNYSGTAKALATSYAAVGKRLQGMGLPNLTGSRHPTLETAAVAFFIEGKSIEGSAVAAGISRDLVEGMVRTVGAAFTDNIGVEELQVGEAELIGNSRCFPKLT